MRLISLSLIASLGSAACDGDKGSPEEGSADTADTGVDTAPPDTGDDTAPPDDTAQPTTLSGTLAAPAGTEPPTEISVALVSVRFGYGPELRPPLDSRLLSGETGFTLDLPAEAPLTDQYQLADEDWPDLLGALYLVMAFEDSSGDGIYQEGERIYGAPPTPLLAWLGEGGDPAWPTGWSLVDLGMAGPYETGYCLEDTSQPLMWRSYAGYPVFSPVEAVEVPLVGLDRTLSLSGSDATGADRLAVLPYQAIYEDPGAAPIWDGALEADFSLSLSGEPDIELALGSPDLLEYALALAVPYADADSSGDYSHGEAIDATFCRDGETSWLRYNWPATTYTGWRVLECYGGNAGWNLVTERDSGVWSSYQQEWSGLELDEEQCDL